MNGFSPRMNASLYGGLQDPRVSRRARVVLPAAYARSSGFGVIPQPVVPLRYDQAYPSPYAYGPPGLPLVAAPSNLRNYPYGDPTSSYTHTHLDTWRPDRLAVSQNSNPCGISSALTYQYDTKDIVIRGKAKVIRQSYLHESPKFEAELVKYLDKKSTDQIPENVVDLLISFINSNDYQNSDVVDEVTLNILAHNVGCKSVVDFSLSNLKKRLEVRNTQELGEITAMILMCTKVDSGLKGWLKKLLEKNNCDFAARLLDDVGFHRLVEDRPEIGVELYRLVGALPQPKDDKYRSL